MTMDATNQANDRASGPASADRGNARELIERYVREVTRRLPQKQRDDVGRELRSGLLDALEDRFGPEPTWTRRRSCSARPDRRAGSPPPTSRPTAT